jgi:hypothetical protein
VGLLRHQTAAAAGQTGTVTNTVIGTDPEQLRLRPLNRAAPTTR